LNQYNDGTYADSHFRRIGLNWLNNDYSCYILHKLYNTFSSGDFGHTDGVVTAPDGTRWLEWISKRLGYRFVLKSATAPEQVVPGASSSITLELENEGYGSLVKARPLEVVFVNAGGTHTAVATSDVRTSLPLQGETVSSEFSFTVPATLTVGQTYEIHVRLPDPHASWESDPDNSIRFANTGIWSAIHGRNSLEMDVVVASS
jgi:hypothetical protein